MQICKPSTLSLSSRPIEFRKRFGLCFSAYLHVPFEQGAAGALWGEQSMWAFVMREMAAPMLDEGVAKLTSEFMLHGFAFPPPKKPNACAVRVRLAEVEKTLLCFGQRHWNGREPSVPPATERIALDWSNAYGGPDYAANPQGIGRAAPSGSAQALPGLELPSERILRADQVVTPAGFGALDLMHPQRAALRGTYDGRYLQEHAPGFPPDLDWRYFNMAPQDQWLPRPLKGDEPYTLDHLHPTRPHIQGTLPGLRVRIFANYRNRPGTAEAHTLREVPMRIGTVWFFPHAERLVLVFHGMAQVDEDDGSDIDHVLGAIERLGQPESDAHYAQELERRLDPVKGGLASLSDAGLVPPGLDLSDPESERAEDAFRMDGLQGEAQYRRAEVEVAMAREQLVSQGKDPDAMGVKLAPREKVPTDRAQLPAYIAAQQALMEKQQLAAMEDMVDQVQKALDFAEANQIDLAALAHRGPPVFRAQHELPKVLAAFHAGKAPFDPKDIADKLARREQADRLGYLQSAHLQSPAFAQPPDVAARTRQEIEWMLGRGLRAWPEIDLTGADLSGLDLRGVDLTGAWLESVNFQRSNLSGALLSGAVLAHADLTDVIAIGASFTAANLGRATLAGAIFDQSDFTGAVLMNCKMDNTQWRSAVFSGANLHETQWGACDWSAAQAQAPLFYKLDMRGLTLADADFSSAIFVECNLSGVDCRNARLAGATFVTCYAAGARFGGAVLDGAVFAKACVLTDADFSQASLRSANLGESDLSGCQLSRAVFDGAFLGSACLAGCDARLASMKGVVLRRAVLKRAQLSGVNFQDAVLQHADLRSSDLRNANLFGADLSRARLNGDVRFDGALLKRARTWPRLSADQQARADALDPL